METALQGLPGGLLCVIAGRAMRLTWVVRLLPVATALGSDIYLAMLYSSLPIPAKVRWFSGNSSITCRMLMKYKTAMPVS